MAKPKLRFSQYTNELRTVVLCDIFKKITRKNSGNFITNVITNSAKEGLISQRKYFEKDVANKDNTEGYYIIEEGDFVYNPRKSIEAPYGPFGRYDYSDVGIISPLYICLKLINKNRINSDFLLYYFKSPAWHRYIYANGDTGVRHDRVSIKDEVLLSMPIYIPNKDEQIKVAQFFKSIDNVIDVINNYILLWEEKKKGVMQKIFSQKVRFKKDDGFDYSKWEEQEIRNLGEFTKGASLSKADISETGTPFILYGELYTTYNEVAYEIKRKTKAIVEDKYYSKIGDVVIPTSGESAEEISTSTCVMKEGVILAGDLNIFRSDVLDGRIMSYILNYQVKNKIAKIAQGKSIVHIQAKELGKIKIQYPADKEEQEKIAEFFSTIDEVIEIKKQKLEIWKNIKKGLLQQMFV